MTRSEAQAMLRVAWRDLDTARFLAVPEAAEVSWGFHLQQAIEKALKAWIISRNRSAPFTHDIADLLEWLQESDEEVERFRTFARFTIFAVQFRYDDEPDRLNLDREQWMTQVNDLLQWIALRISD